MPISLTPFQIEIVERLNGLGAEFIVIGGKALHHYGCDRESIDLDLWVSISGENPNKVYRLAAEYNESIRESRMPEDFSEPRKLVKLPNSSEAEVDLLTSVGALDFKRARANSIYAAVDRRGFHVLGLPELIYSKAISAAQNEGTDGSKRDKVDLAWLVKSFAEGS